MVVYFLFISWILHMCIFGSVRLIVEVRCIYYDGWCMCVIEVERLLYLHKTVVNIIDTAWRPLSLFSGRKSVSEK